MLPVVFSGVHAARIEEEYAVVRIVLCILTVGIGVCAGAAGAIESEKDGTPGGWNRTSAIQAFMNGDFMPYRRYLEASLAWHLKQMEARPFDRKKIGEEILRSSVRNHVKLTQDEFEQKIEEAHKLVQGFGGGWQSVHREQVRQLYESLAILCSVMSDHECELKNRKSASQYE